MLLPAMKKSILTITMVITTCLIVLQAQVPEEEHEEETNTGIQDIDLSIWQQSYNENQKLLVLFYQLDKCDTCPTILDTLTQFQGKPEFPTDLKIVKSFNSDLVTKLSIEQFPTLVYLRDKSHVAYDGTYDVQDLLEWVKLATNKITQRLDDESFQRLIDAATGNITDAWLVAFYKETCKNVLPVVETFGVRVHGHINVAKVHIPESPRLTKRLKVTDCPEIIFFKEGMMYKYHLPTLDAASLRNFVDTLFKEVQAQLVPEDIPDTDFMSGNFSDYMKIYSLDDKSIVLVSVSAVVAILMLIIICCCRRSVKKHPKKAKKE